MCFQIKPENNMNRRTLLAGVSALAISGCATFSANFARAADDVSTIAAGLQQVLNNPAVAGLVPVSIMEQANVWLVQLQQAAGSLKLAVTTGGAQDAVHQAEVLINAIVGALSKFPLPAPIPQILLAATILLPIIEAAVGMLIKPTANVSSMSPEQARITLKAYAQKK